MCANSSNATPEPAPSIQSANAPAAADTRAGVLADTTNVHTGESSCGAADCSVMFGGASITTCALVPPNPNDDTPAIRRSESAFSRAGHGVGSATTFSRSFSNGM